MARFIALLLLPVAAVAQTHPAATRTATAAHRRASAPGSAGISDPELEKAIRSRFSRSKIGANHFEVHVQGGVATLEGNTEVVQHKGTATRLAKTAGATSVVNHIRVSQAARQRAAANLEKGRRRAQIKRGESPSDRSQPRQSR
jgi:osmotically-inducible protein OsmY